MTKQGVHPNNIRLIRIWRCLTQLELADAAGCSQTAVCRCESGDRQLSPRLRAAFARVLEVPPRMLDEPVTIIFKPWERLVTDPRLPILVEELLSYDSKHVSRLVHTVSERMKHDIAL